MAIPVDHLVLHDLYGQPLTYELKTENGQSWVETRRPGQLYHPLDLSIGNEFHEPLLILFIDPYWSLYGHIDGHQAETLRTYFAELEKLGWTPDFEPARGDAPMYQTYRENRAKFAENRRRRAKQE